MSKERKILLVCTGNSCRSVMAAGLLKEILPQKEKYRIMTAGTSAFNEGPATIETIQVMLEYGIDVSNHKSRALDKEMINNADLILVMEEKQKQYVLDQMPGARNKVHLLSEFGRISGENRLVDPNIPDPIGHPLEYYRKILHIIRESIERTAKKLSEEL